MSEYDKIQLNTIDEAIQSMKNGEFVIVVDDEDRENEGDFIIAAEKITEEKVNFMLREGRGVLCAPLTTQRCHELDLNMQVEDNTSMLGTPFTVTVDMLKGCTTGVSMHDRPISVALATLIRFAHKTRVCSRVPATPRPLSTSHALLAFTLRLP